MLDKQKVDSTESKILETKLLDIIFNIFYDFNFQVAFVIFITPTMSCSYGRILRRTTLTCFTDIYEIVMYAYQKKKNKQPKKTTAAYHY